MQKIITTDDPNYKAYRKIFFPDGKGAKNGAYFYSKEIEKNIIPNVKTDRPWDTLGMQALRSEDRAIVFIHHNKEWGKVYSWLDKYKDLIYVCSVPQTYEWAKSIGKTAIYLPLSIDVDYVKQFETEKTKEACYAGNKWGFKKKDLAEMVPSGVDFPDENIDREELLKFIAPYKECYAVGRCALEARALGCKIKVCDSRYPDPAIWQVLDNKDAAKILQEELDKIDG